MRHIYKILTAIITLISLSSRIQAQDEKPCNYLGLNIIQLTAHTFEFIYEIEQNHRFDFLISSGFTINYDYSWADNHHFKCYIGDGYDMKMQSGGFLKIGVKYNFRRDSKKIVFPYLGINIINSLVSEKALRREYDSSYISYELIPVEHNLFVAGIGLNMGITFKIQRFYIDSGFQLSGALINNDDLFGSFNYVPGMGSINGCRYFRRRNAIIAIRYKF